MRTPQVPSCCVCPSLAQQGPHSGCKRTLAVKGEIQGNFGRQFAKGTLLLSLPNAVTQGRSSGVLLSPHLSAAGVCGWDVTSLLFGAVGDRFSTDFLGRYDEIS